MRVVCLRMKVVLGVSISNCQWVGLGLSENERSIKSVCLGYYLGFECRYHSTCQACTAFECTHLFFSYVVGWLRMYYWVIFLGWAVIL